ncbi:hypothetical protein CH267_00225 [Rhodococcus sp. 06-621-2]|nr:hypothetical protein CH267_00225 [Rhodococcus sp. 06-621-2]
MHLPERRLGVWDSPIPLPERTPAPMLWLLGAHGGAGVSTLAHVLAPAGDCGDRWPGGHGKQSPYVAVVARETVSGLVRAGELLRQHTAGHGGPAKVIGLITVADRPGRKLPKQIHQTRDVVTALVDREWRIGWVEQYPLARDPSGLAVWSPFDPPPEKKRSPTDVPADIAAVGTQLREAILSDVQRTTSPTEGNP